MTPPDDIDLATAWNALQDAAQEALFDARRARAAGDFFGAEADEQRAERLLRVRAWLTVVPTPARETG